VGSFTEGGPALYRAEVRQGVGVPSMDGDEGALQCHQLLGGE
jgi:hypothetical protein